MKSIKKAASKAAAKLGEAAAATDKAIIQAATNAAALAVTDAVRVAEELAKQAEADRLLEEAKRLEEATKRALEEETRRAIEAAQKAAEDLKREADNLVKEQVSGALNTIVGNINEFTEAGQAFVKQIESEIQNLIELANIDALKRKLLQKAEELSEEYLRSKLVPIAESISLAAVPDVKLDLSTSSIKIEVFVYFLLLQDKESDPGAHAIAVMNTDLEQEITKLSAPEVDVQFDFNQDKLEAKLRNQIIEEIAKKREDLIKGFLKSFFSDYFAVFDKIIKLLPK
ncbi:hypothetical protein ACN6AX_25190 [Paenibacillus polymyxa]